MIHGVQPTPIVWAELTNELWGTPAVRERYQVWHFLYPTGAPFLYPAWSLRKQLDEVRALLAARAPGRAPQIVLLAHSMGGLLARTLVTDSGEAVWHTMFEVPATALRGSRDDAARVDEILHWSARGDVERVIFLAVPHRGSELADRATVRLAGAFAGVPGNLTRLYRRIAAANPRALSPPFKRALTSGTLSSVGTLSPQHPALAAMAGLPFRAGLHVHSIIGDRGEPGPIDASSDGVVPYWSSHLGGVESELIVPEGHRVFAHPDAVREIVRILDGAAAPAQ
jgi:hypothetical protein